MVATFVASTLFLAGSVFFPSVFLILQRLWKTTSYGSHLRKAHKLSEKDCTDISVKLVSTLQAILASVCGIVVCSKCYHDVLHCQDALVSLYAWFGAPYFLYDGMVMFYVYKLSATDGNPSGGTGLLEELRRFFHFFKASPVICIHHLIMAPIGFSIIIYFRGSRGDFFIAVMYVMEASTPFVSFRAILSKMKMKASKLYVYNGILMLISFPVFRIASVLYTVHLYAVQQEMGFLEAIYSMHPVWLMVLIASLAPQVYWYNSMLSGLCKIVKESKSSAKPASAFSTSPDAQSITKS